jgi:hypothetical protein
MTSIPRAAGTRYHVRRLVMAMAKMIRKYMNPS